MKQRRLAVLGAAALGIGLVMPGSRLDAQQSTPMATPSISIESPAPGTTLPGNTMDVAVKVANFKVECADAGQPGLSAMQGHIHAMVDGMDMAHLSNMYCSDHFAISTDGLKPGKHMLTVVLANDAHAMASLPVSVPFSLSAAGSQALPPPSAAKETIAIVSPKNGDVVGRKFDVKLAVQGFNASCDLEGRQDIAGTGHFHIFASQAGVTDKTGTAPMMAMLSTDAGKMMAAKLSKDTGMSMDELKPMMGMAMPSLLAMPCTTTIPVDLTTWKAGPAKLMVMLANNDHMPTPGVAPASISVVLK